MTAIGYQLSSLKPVLCCVQQVQEALRRLKEMGYHTLQIQWISPEVPDEAVANALLENEMTCLGVQDRYPAIREGFERFVRQNRLFGGSDLCISGIPPENFSEEGIAAYAGELGCMSARLAGEGMSLSFHPVSVDYAPVNGIPALMRLLDALPDMKLTLCVYHAVRAGLDPAALLERYRGRVDIVHFKDYAVGADGEAYLVPTGQGEIDWPPIFAACSRTGVRWGLAEQERWRKDPFVCAQESRRYILENGIADAQQDR
ncbi:MAG: sugar phosphate isomerase/epimerase [Provencibacterium sp.]|nr:sugar phosphate isomerase/epimerase [Provencibacterium sp.]